MYLDGNLDNLYDLTFMPDVEGMRSDRAEDQIRAAGLVPVVVIPRPVDRRVWDQEEVYEEDEYGETWVIYRQFPNPGQHIQRGTQVRLRAREAD